MKFRIGDNRNAKLLFLKRLKLLKNIQGMAFDDVAANIGIKYVHQLILPLAEEVYLLFHLKTDVTQSDIKLN